jgi:hypothetical protein
MLFQLIDSATENDSLSSRVITTVPNRSRCQSERSFLRRGVFTAEAISILDPAAWKPWARDMPLLSLGAA